MSESPVSAPPPPTRLGRAEHSSLALPIVLNKLDPPHTARVLDLGPAIGPNVDFFSGLVRRLTIGDLFESLQAHEEVFGPVQDERFLFETLLLPPPDGARFDVVFAWDLMNYFEPTRLAALESRLVDLCADGGLIYALLSARSPIPARPRNYRILDRSRLSYEATTLAVRDCPLYEERDLTRAMPGLGVRNTFILRNGVKEFLFFVKREK